MTRLSLLYHQRRWKARLRLNGGCIACSRPRGVDGNNFYCAKCAVKQACRTKKYAVKRREEWCELGVCLRCGGKRDKGVELVTCKACREYGSLWKKWKRTTK